MKNLIFKMAVSWGVLAPLSAYADVSSTYGLGSSSAALAGANKTFTYDAFASARVPSLMSNQNVSEFSLGFLGAQAIFPNINSVLTDSDYLGGSTTTGNVNTSVQSTELFLLGTELAVGKSARKFRVGVTFAVPVSKLAAVETKDVYTPQYSMYMSDANKLQATLGVSWKAWERWSFGIGTHVFFSTGATMQSRLPTDGSTRRTSSVNFKVDVKPAVAAIASLTYEPWNDHLFTLAYIGERDARMSFNTYTGIGILGPNPVPLYLNGRASLFYDPEIYSFGYGLRQESTQWMLGLDWERWSRFDGAVVKLDFQNNPSFNQYAPDMRHKDIMVPRVGVSTKWGGDNDFQTGYAFRPSPVPDQTGETNFLDSDRHIVGMGYIFHIRSLWLAEIPARLATHVQWQELVPKKVVKNSGTYIGAPSYDIKGSVYSYGLNMTAEF